MPVSKVVVGGKQRGASEKETCLIREWLGERVQQHGQSAPPLAVPQLGSCTSSGCTCWLWVARHSQGEARPRGPQQLTHSCSSEPPPKPLISLRLAIQVLVVETPLPRGGTLPSYHPHP